jgi:hypothetical protein
MPNAISGLTVISEELVDAESQIASAKPPLLGSATIDDGDVHPDGRRVHAAYTQDQIGVVDFLRRTRWRVRFQEKRVYAMSPELLVRRQ